MRDKFGLLYDVRFSQEFIDNDCNLDFAEVIPDRLLSFRSLDGIPSFWNRLPIVFHCLDFSLGSAAPVDRDYLKKISALASQMRPMWISDHLAITRFDQVPLGHLSPIRMRSSTIELLCQKIDIIQNELQTPFLIENISYYFKIPGSDLTEVELFRRLVEKTGCRILLDLNNVLVNSKNHGFNPFIYLQELPLDAVQEIHIGGHRNNGNMYIDSHGDPVCEEVWSLLRYVSARMTSINVILERDQNVPPFTELVNELALAKRYVFAGRKESLRDVTPEQRAER